MHRIDNPAARGQSFLGPAWAVDGAFWSSKQPELPAANAWAGRGSVGLPRYRQNIGVPGTWRRVIGREVASAPKAFHLGPLDRFWAEVGALPHGSGFGETP
jgi:hypothetical protein